MFYISYFWHQCSLEICPLSSLTACFRFCVTSSAVLAYLAGNVQCMQAWKKIILEGRWKDRNILNWCHHWRQHAVELKPSFWRISWSADGVEIQRYATYFVFHSPRVWGLCSRSSLWIVESCLFMGFTCHSKPLSILYPSM